MLIPVPQFSLNGVYTPVTIQGTANRVTVSSPVNGVVTLSGPQDLHSGASPMFAGLTIGTLAGVLKATGGALAGSASTSDLPEGSNLYFTGPRAAAAAPVQSVANSNGSLTVSPTTGNVVASLNLAHANTWSALQTFQAATSTTAAQVIQGAAGQSANPWEYWDSDGRVRTMIQADGTIAVCLSGFSGLAEISLQPTGYIFFRSSTGIYSNGFLTIGARGSQGNIAWFDTDGGLGAAHHPADRDWWRQPCNECALDRPGGCRPIRWPTTNAGWQQQHPAHPQSYRLRGSLRWQLGRILVF
jgi:phospholipase/lecithinase/hemolysin